jgi:hypothetical protein
MRTTESWLSFVSETLLEEGSGWQMRKASSKYIPCYAPVTIPKVGQVRIGIVGVRVAGL